MRDIALHWQSEKFTQRLCFIYCDGCEIDVESESFLCGEKRLIYGHRSFLVDVHQSSRTLRDRPGHFTARGPYLAIPVRPA